MKNREDKKKVPAAIRRIKTMANALLRDVTRKLLGITSLTPPNIFLSD